MSASGSSCRKRRAVARPIIPAPMIPMRCGEAFTGLQCKCCGGSDSGPRTTRDLFGHYGPRIHSSCNRLNREPWPGASASGLKGAGATEISGISDHIQTVPTSPHYVPNSVVSPCLALLRLASMSPPPIPEQDLEGPLGTRKSSRASVRPRGQSPH